MSKEILPRREQFESIRGTPMVQWRRKWRSVFLVLFAFIAVPWADGGNPAADDTLRLRILSYNIHHGEGMDGELDLARIAKVINAVNPDVVALQEVDAGTQRSEQVDQPAVLARLSDLNVVFGGNIRYQGGDYGNAVLSRFPIVRHKNHPLPRFDDGEQRGVLEVHVKLPDGAGTLLFLATHLDHRPGDRERLASAAAINKIAAGQAKPSAKPSRAGTSDGGGNFSNQNNGTDHGPNRAPPREPALLAGDLNDVPNSETLRKFKTVWALANREVLPTFPAKEPDKQIDFILFRPDARWKTIDVRVLAEPVASDHRPILAVLELLPASSAQSD
ncbi:MAG: endonuclease/exonuclease/phosphatase family protein [Planctomycetota bacterium]